MDSGISVNNELIEAIDIIMKRTKEKEEKVKTSFASSNCLGMTFFWLSSSSKDNLTLCAAHALADIITSVWRIGGIEDYMHILNIDDSLLSKAIQLMNFIALELGYINTYISILRSQRIRSDFEDLLVHISLISDSYLYDPASVVNTVVHYGKFIGTWEEIKNSKASVHLKISTYPNLRNIDNDIIKFSIQDSINIGKGSFGSIYKWKNFAIKTVPLVNEDFEPIYESSLREIAILSGIISDDIIKLHSSVIIGDIIILSLDLAIGDMHAKYKSQEIKHDWLLSLIRGIKYLHNMNVVHRDIKPENILIMTDGRLVISDLGSCIMYTSDTKLKNISGTYNYLDYGILTYLDQLNNVNISTATIMPELPSLYFYYGIDIWAAACTILSLLSEQYPFFRGPNQTDNTPYYLLRDMEIKLIGTEAFSDLNINNDMRTLLVLMLDINHETRLTAQDAYIILQTIEFNN